MSDNSVRNTDIKTVRKLVTTAGTSIGAPAVPAGMKRWVTFIRATNEFGAFQNLYVCSCTSAVYATTMAKASATAKVNLILGALGHQNLPEAGPTDYSYPLFSIAEDKYINAYPTKGNASLFIQYYDE
ncbi:hypothetical protein KKH23_05500 [Patescibacteria group bacterium]|nr:hypothetical protein [Patescibacteria group bacterium]